MAETDVAVTRDGKRYRLVTNGERAGLFGKTGLIETLSVAMPATAPQRMPELETTDGAHVSLARTSKPCSCTGYPWNASARDLREAIA